MSLFASTIRRVVRPIHQQFRNSKSEIFLTMVGANTSGTLLDVGGGTGIYGEFGPLYKRFDSVTVVNLDPPRLDGEEHRGGHTKVRYVEADGRCLPFADRAFDWVFSNAVIEHVGNWNQQMRFAAEIRRVAKNGYFVTTPNLYFPLEPHSLLPLYQFYPQRLRPLALRVSPGYMKHVEEINLLSKGKMRRLFPEARLRYVNFASGLIAYHASSGIWQLSVSQKSKERSNGS